MAATSHHRLSDYFAEQRGELLESLEHEREELREAVHELTGAARSTITVSEYIRAAPLSWLLGGFMLGLWLGARRRPVVEIKTVRSVT